MNTTQQAIKAASSASIEEFTSYADASGATALISYKGFRFAFSCGDLSDFLSKGTLINPSYGSRVENKIAADVCRRVWRDLVMSLGAEYHTRNSELYKAK